MAQKRVRSPWLLLLGGVVAALIVAGIGLAWHHHETAYRPREPSGGAPRTYNAVVAHWSQIVDGAAQIEAGQRGEWLVEERLANAYISRARLTGSFDDYAAAQAALDRGFAKAPHGAGPFQTQAALAFAMHRLQRTSDALDALQHAAVPPEQEVLTEIVATRGDIAFYRGHYDEAIRLYRGASPDPNDGGDLYRIANWQARTGQPDQALATLDKLERTARLPNAQFLADLALRRGTVELQRGRWDPASAYFDRAARLFPGYWLIDAHRAQMLALQGQTAAAIASFETIARRNASPDVMDALAAIYRAQGNRDRSAFWADQARMLWNQRLALFPEAAYGHVVEHLLAFGDPASALDFAKRDYASRPYGQTATALAWCLIASNRPAEALAVIKPVLASKWVAAESHLVAAQADLLLGQSDAADAEQQAALEINPLAADRRSSLIWFGH